jgi:hypothetical protein
LLVEGGRREDLWGATWYVESREAMLEALVNVKPRHGNAWLRIENREERQRVESLVRRLLEGRGDGAGAAEVPLGFAARRKAARERFLRETVPGRLAGIATTLARAASVAPHAGHAGHASSAAELVDDARHFIEWTGAELDPTWTAELVDLQIVLTLWLRGWDAAMTDPAHRALLAHEARRWSDRLGDLAAVAQATAPPGSTAGAGSAGAARRATAARGASGEQG